MDFKTLREKYDTFVYHGFSAEKSGAFLRAEFDFSLGDLHFAPKWEFPCPENAEIDGTVQRLLCALGLVEAISYYKCACPARVLVKAAQMNDFQVKWFEKLFFEGLSEFRYKNGIALGASEFVHITSSGKAQPPAVTKPLSGNLIAVGGGKDSAVSLSLLSGFDDNHAFIINPRGASLACVSIAGLENKLLAPKRTLDPEIMRLNAQGYLNGHTPFSAMAAFAAVLCAYLNGIKYVVLSNESSANESTVEGLSVNHQYSKTYEFERDFREYIAACVPCGAEYFSLLRPYSEFQIARAFAKEEKYLDVFKSCNVGSKTDSWCAACPKCLFVYIMLSPFIEQARLARIFGKNMLEDVSLIPTLDKLIGLAPEKPFECVGSRAEAVYALSLAVKKCGADLALLKYFSETPLAKTQSERFEHYFDGQNFVPEKFKFTFDIMRDL